MSRLTGTAALLAIVCCLLLPLGQARFVIEKGGLKLRFPTDARKAHPDGFDMSLANFGAPRYGGELVAQLVYVDPEHGQSNDCHEIPCRFGCTEFLAATPAFDVRNSARDYIIMVDRGPVDDGQTPCKFAQKVYNAQKAGAKGVVVVNYEDRHTTMEAPDDQDEISYQWLRNITIPAVFIMKSDGQVLKDLLRTSGGTAAPEVLVSMDWTDVLPRAERVSWEFWTNSNDMCGPTCDVQAEFIREFVPAARELEENGWTRFEPHYIVWICPEIYRDSDECRSQCIHHGRYCTPDPDGDLLAGYSGKDIVQENLRQLCVFKLANESNVPWVWWEYVTRFADECKMSDNKYNEDCAEKVFTEINGAQWSSLEKLRSCIGDIDADADNAQMEFEIQSQRGNADVGEVYILPTIRINNGQYRGKLSYSEVLRALCAAFTKGTEPPPCLRVTQDDCRPGSVGAEECARRTDGKTACKNTFSGYDCKCGPGFLEHPEANGTVTCLNINQCLTTEASQLGCDCPRCACKDTYGGFECIKDIRDECAQDFGGCWRGEFTVKGAKKQFHACHDNLDEYKAAAARGAPGLEQVPLHTCVCPPCFTEFLRGDNMECVPKCDLDYCEEATGICTQPAAKASGVGGFAVVGIVLLCLGLVGVAGYAAYRLRLRSAMHQEIRAIMAQYMPLESQPAAEEHQNAGV